MTDPAPAPAPAPAPSPAPNPFDPGALQAEDKGWFDNKGYKDMSTLVAATRGLEKVMGAPKERLVVLPEKADDPKWAEIHGRLGRPETADKYDLGLPPEMMTGKTMKRFTETFHKAGVPQSAAKSIVTEFMAEQKEQAEAAETAFLQKAEADTTALRAKLGAAFDQEIGAAKAAAKSYGMSVEEADKIERAIGTSRFLEMWIGIGKAQGEHAVHGTTNSGAAGKGFGTLSPEAAKSQVSTLFTDKAFMDRYTHTNPAIRAVAIAEMERLQKAAVGR